MFIRCSPNQLLKTSDNAINTFQPTTGEEFDHPDTVKLPNQSTITSNQLTVTSPCAHKIISSLNPTDLPDNPLPPPNHMHTNELPNNQLGDITPMNRLITDSPTISNQILPQTIHLK